MEDFAARVDFDDGGEGEDGEEAEGDGESAVDAEEEAGVGGAEEVVPDVFCGWERGGGI